MQGNSLSEAKGSKASVRPLCNFGLSPNKGRDRATRSIGADFNVFPVFQNFGWPPYCNPRPLMVGVCFGSFIWRILDDIKPTECGVLTPLQNGPLVVEGFGSTTHVVGIPAFCRQQQGWAY